MIEIPRAVRMTSLIAGGLLATGLATAGPGIAQSAGIEGIWRGSGRLVLTSGDAERATCRVRFARQSAARFTMTAVCATQSVRVAQTADLRRAAANVYTGRFHNEEFGVSGSVRITVRGNKLTAALRGDGGRVTFHLSRR